MSLELGMYYYGTNIFHETSANAGTLMLSNCQYFADADTNTDSLVKLDVIRKLLRTVMTGSRAEKFHSHHHTHKY